MYPRKRQRISVVKLEHCDFETFFSKIKDNISSRWYIIRREVDDRTITEFFYIADVDGFDVRVIVDEFGYWKAKVHGKDITSLIQLSVKLDSPSNLSVLLSHIAQIKICCGIPYKDDWIEFLTHNILIDGKNEPVAWKHDGHLFSILKNKQKHLFSNCLRSLNCEIISQSSSCNKCKYLRNIIQKLKENKKGTVEKKEEDEMCKMMYECVHQGLFEKCTTFKNYLGDLLKNLIIARKSGPNSIKWSDSSIKMSLLLLHFLKSGEYRTVRGHGWDGNMWNGLFILPHSKTLSRYKRMIPFSFGWNHFNISYFIDSVTQAHNDTNLPNKYVSHIALDEMYHRSGLVFQKTRSINKVVGFVAYGDDSDVVQNIKKYMLLLNDEDLCHLDALVSHIQGKEEIVEEGDVNDELPLLRQLGTMISQVPQFIEEESGTFLSMTNGIVRKIVEIDEKIITKEESKHEIGSTILQMAHYSSNNMQRILLACFCVSTISAEKLIMLLYIFLYRLHSECIKRNQYVDVMSVCSDGFPSMRRLSKRYALNGTIFNPFSRRFIYILSDPQHLIKRYCYELHHTLENKELKLPDGTYAVMDDLRKLHKKEQKRALNLSGLTYQHLYPSSRSKIKVKFSSDLFKSCVISALKEYMDEESKGTQLYLHFGRLMKEAFRSAKKITSMEDIKILKDIISFFNGWKEAVESDQFVSSEFYYDLKLTVNNYMSMINELLEMGINPIPRAFSTDVVEYIFSMIRTFNGCDEVPNALNYLDRLRICYVDCALRGKGSNTSYDLDSIPSSINFDQIKKYNEIVQNDFEETYHRFSNISKSRIERSECSKNGTDLSSPASFHYILNSEEKKGIKYISGAVLKKVLDKNREEEEILKLIESRSLLITPIPSFTNFIGKITSAFGSFISKERIKNDHKYTLHTIEKIIENDGTIIHMWSLFSLKKSVMIQIIEITLTILFDQYLHLQDMSPEVGVVSFRKSLK